VPSLELPPWVPPAVVRQARILHAQAVDGRDIMGIANVNPHEAMTLIERLATDPRMRTVWGSGVLRRRRQNHRPTDAAFNPAMLPPYVRDPGNPVARQALAAGVLFHFAVFFRLAGVRAIPVKVRSHNPHFDPADLLVVGRSRGNLDVRGYVICLAEQCRELFFDSDSRDTQRGVAMYRTVATIASVALDRSIKPHAVEKQYLQQRARANRYGGHPKAVQKRVRQHP